MNVRTTHGPGSVWVCNPRSFILMCVPVVEIIALILEKNKARQAAGHPDYRFADLYHSAIRTPTSTPEASCAISNGWM